MLHLLLVRHGETEWNAQHRYQGASDLPLNARGIEQAHRLALRLKPQKIDLVFSSDLQRAIETARILVGGRDIQPQADSKLREMNFGVLEGHSFDDALKRWPEMITKWLEDYNQPPEGGERIDKFNQRVAQFYSGLVQNYDQKTVLIVAHGGPLREIIQILLGHPISPAWWFNLDHASLSEFQVDSENVIINRLNDTGHFSD